MNYEIKRNTPDICRGCYYYEIHGDNECNFDCNISTIQPKCKYNFRELEKVGELIEYE